jgi:hypothetical protein
MDNKTITMKQARRLYRRNYLKIDKEFKARAREARMTPYEFYYFCALPIPGVPHSFREWARSLVANKSLSFQHPVGKLALICGR